MFQIRCRSLTLCAVLVALTTAGCGVRADLGPEQLPPLSVDQVARNAAASCEANTATALTAFSEQLPAAHANIAAARERLKVFGGVWDPWPQGRPAGAMSAPHQPQPGSTRPEILQYLSNCATQAGVDAKAVVDPALAALLQATAIARTAELQDLAQQWSLPVPTGNAEVARALVVKNGKYQAAAATDATNLVAERKRRLGKTATQAVLSLDQARSDLEYASAQDSSLPREHLHELSQGLLITVNALENKGYRITQPRLYAADPNLDPQTLYLDALKRATNALVTLSALPEVTAVTTPALELILQARHEAGVKLGSLPGIP